MLNDISFFSNVLKSNAAISSSKQLFGENVPYTIERKITGKVVIFNDHFIRTAREAMSTGCMAKMNMTETNLFLRFIEFQNNNVYRDITDPSDIVLTSLNDYMMNAVYLTNQLVVNGCYGSADHTWYIP